MNKDFFLYNRLGYAVNDKKSNIALGDINKVCKEVSLVDKYRLPCMRVKMCVGTIGTQKCFLSVCSTEFNSDKQHVYIEVRPTSEIADMRKIFHIIKETYKANINNYTKEKHS